MSGSERKAVRAVIRGRVQGVWFRGWTMQTAAALGLGGWVRNRADGTVEAVFAGPGDAVDRMLEFCRKGPPAAVVMDVLVDPAEDPGPRPFGQRPTV